MGHQCPLLQRLLRVRRSCPALRTWSSSHLEVITYWEAISLSPPGCFRSMQGWAKGRVCEPLRHFLSRDLGDIGIPGALISGLLPEVEGLGLCPNRALGLGFWEQVWF